MRNATLLVLAALLATSTVTAQNRQKIDFVLNAYLEREHAPDDQVDLFIHGSAGTVSEAVRANGGLVKMSMGRLVSARLPVARVRQLAASSAVERFEFSMAPVRTLCDSMRVKARVNEVQAGLAPLPQAYDGSGVVVGIIDTGLDVAHPDFKNPDGSTRVLYYWDQALSGVGAPAEFGYGLEWDQAQINGGQLGSNDTNGHGSTVTGCAAGNGLANGRHKGVASGADIIVVKHSPAQEASHPVVVDGVKYIFDRARSLGKPAVVNISLGSFSGSHDGNDAAALFIDSLVSAERGRAVVCAGGNQFEDYPFHMHTDVGPDTTFTWFQTNSFDLNYNLFPYPNVFFEVWADSLDFAGVQYAMGADNYTPSFSFRGRTPFHAAAENYGTVITDPIVSSGGDTLGTVQYLALQRGDQIQLQVLMAQPDSAANFWRFMTTGSGSFDVWSTVVLGIRTSNMMSDTLAVPFGLPFPTVQQYAPMAHYVPPNRKQTIADSWACSPKTLTVANYWNLTAYTGYDGTFVDSGTIPYAIVGNSSSGPTRDLREKPEIAAPGTITMASAPLANLASLIANEPYKVDPGGMHARNGGTSMASPVIAGAVALYLEKCPNASWSQIRQAFLSTTWGDGLTGALPNNRFGYGRVHAFDALVTSNLPDIAITATDDEMCPEGSVEATAPAGYDAYLWSNGATDNPTTYTGPGPLTVVASTATGCAHSNTLNFTVWPSPPVPTITAAEAELTSSAAPGYQWYLDGDPIGGANGQVYIALENGSYTVEITDANGCTALSAPEAVMISGIEGAASKDFSVWPSPTSGSVTVQTPSSGSGAVEIEVFDADGRKVISRREPNGGTINLELDGVAAGTYALRVRQGEVLWETRFAVLP